MRPGQNEHFPQNIGLLVWLRNANDYKKMYQFGEIVYRSRKFKYVHLYVEAAKYKEVRGKLQRAHFVSRVQASQQPNLNFEPEHQKELLEDLRVKAQLQNEREREAYL